MLRELSRGNSLLEKIRIDSLAAIERYKAELASGARNHPVADSAKAISLLSHSQSLSGKTMSAASPQSIQAAPRTDWPENVRKLAERAIPSDIGVGDILERVIASGVIETISSGAVKILVEHKGSAATFKNAMNHWLRLPCTCEQDKKRLNELYPLNTMTKIRDNLYLGGSGGVNLSDLDANKITAVLCVADDFTDPHEVRMKYECLWVGLRDGDRPNRITTVNQAVQMLDAALAAGHTVLCHCISGANRAPTIVALYLAMESRFPKTLEPGTCMVPFDEKWKELRSLRSAVGEESKVIKHMADF